MALHTMRLMEHWRTAFGTLDRAIVILAVTAITAERLTRGELPEGLASLRSIMPQNTLGKCNISSIAAASGLNRETARRKVNELVSDGFLVREKDGSVAFNNGFGGQQWVLDLVSKQLTTVAKTTKDLASDGVLEFR
jgi:DNA-binding IclR family transcriptional regulator